MKTKTLAKLLLPLFLLTFVLGCATVKGWFGSKKKGSDQSPDVMAQEGINDLRKKNYIDAAETFQKVRDRYPYSDQALLAQIKLADAYYYQKKYDEALQAYKDFEKLHPTNKAVPYCIFREGLCFFKQRSTIDRDQTYNLKALAEFRRLKQKFPKSEYCLKADKLIALCRKDLADNEFYIAEFYYKTKHYQAALDRYQALDQDYPEFTKRAEVEKRIETCQKILATPPSKSKGFFSGIASIFDAKW